MFSVISLHKYDHPVSSTRYVCHVGRKMQASHISLCNDGCMREYRVLTIFPFPFYPRTAQTDGINDFHFTICICEETVSYMPSFCSKYEYHKRLSMVISS